MARGEAEMEGHARRLGRGGGKVAGSARGDLGSQRRARCGEGQVGGGAGPAGALLAERGTPMHGELGTGEWGTGAGRAAPPLAVPARRREEVPRRGRQGQVGGLPARVFAGAHGGRSSGRLQGRLRRGPVRPTLRSGGCCSSRGSGPHFQWPIRKRKGAGSARVLARVSGAHLRPLALGKPWPSRLLRARHPFPTESRSGRGGRRLSDAGGGSWRVRWP